METDIPALVLSLARPNAERRGHVSFDFSVESSSMLGLAIPVQKLPCGNDLSLFVPFPALPARLVLPHNLRQLACSNLL